MRWRAHFAAACLVCGIALSDVPVEAQAQRSPYQEAIARALQEFNLGHWTEAKVFFMQAHVLKPSARTLRGMGLASYESRNYVEALDYLQQALASVVQPLTPDMRSAAVRLIDQSKQFVMRVEVDLEPAAAELLVDGKPVRVAADGTILLDPGEHELTVLASGFDPLRRRVNTEGGSQTRLHFVLTPRPTAPVTVVQPALELTPPQPSAASPSTRPEPAEESGSIAPWLVMGGGVAIAAGGGVLLALGLSAKAEVENARDGGDWSDAESANGRAVPLQTAGGVMLGVGAAAFAAGLAWQLWPSAETQSLTVSASGLGLDLRQSF